MCQYARVRRLLRMRKLVGNLATLAILVGCSSLLNHTDNSVASRNIPSDLLIPVSLYDIRGEVAPLEESKALHEPLGIPRLRTTNFQKGTREIRIYTGIVIAYPRSGLIVHEQAGRVSGVLFRYWPVDDSAFDESLGAEQRFTENEAGRCRTIVRGKDATLCVVRFSREPDWRALLGSLDSANAWNLPDESQVPSRGMVIDGWVIRVEARRDTSYRRYQYHNPQVYRPPEGANALHIMGILDSLFRYTVPPQNLQYVRGIYLYGHDTSDFIPCSHPQDVGFFEGRLSPVTKLIGDSAWRAHAAPTKSFALEAWVRRQDHTTERYSRTFQRLWSVDSVTVVKLTPTRSCR